MALKRKPLGGIGVIRMHSGKERDQYVAALVSQWEKEALRKGPIEKPLPFITISRQYGCLAMELGMRLANRLNSIRPSGLLWAVYDREIVQRIADDLQISKSLIEHLTEHSRARLTEYLDTHFQKRPTRDAIFRKMVQTVRGLCEKGHSILIGRGASIIAAGSPAGFHLRIVAPMEWRIRQVVDFYKLSPEEAEKRIHLVDKEREGFTRELFDRDISDPDLYDIIVNQSGFSTDQTVELIIHAMQSRGLYHLD